MDGHTALTAAFNHGFAYWLYGGFEPGGGPFVWKYVPETKGMTLENMQKLWHVKVAGLSRCRKSTNPAVCLRRGIPLQNL